MCSLHSHYTNQDYRCVHSIHTRLTSNQDYRCVRFPQFQFNHVLVFNLIFLKLVIYALWKKLKKYKRKKGTLCKKLFMISETPTSLYPNDLWYFKRDEIVLIWKFKVLYHNVAKIEGIKIFNLWQNSIS